MEEQYNQEFENPNCENNAELLEYKLNTKEIFSNPIMKGIIAAVAVLVIVLLFAILVPKNGNGNVNENEQNNGGASGSGEVSNDTQVKNAVLVAMSRELMLYNYGRSDDDKMYLRQTLYNSIQSLDQYGLQYKVYGKQKFD